jgi:translation initiation factor IF-3
LLLRFANDLEDYGKVEQMPALEGKKMIIMLAPKKTSSAQKPVAKLVVIKPGAAKQEE